jgi:BirA family biotin operon repressor/biotin-[acetyl-CoA-carboxylase] ligase
LAGRKFGGILTETGSLQGMATGRKPFVVIGAGINLFTPEGGFQNDLKDCATSISVHTERKISGESLLLASTVAIEQEVQRLEKGEFQEILTEWMERDGVKDKILTWVTPQGKEVTGVSLGPDADGVLRIRDGAGNIHSIISGDVNLVGKIPE